MPNGRTPLDPHYAYKLAWLHALAGHLGVSRRRRDALRGPRRLQHRPSRRRRLGHRGVRREHPCDPPERAAIAELRALGLVDVIPTISKGPHPYTYWDYRAGSFHKAMGMRIDLVLANAGFADRVTGASSTGTPESPV